MVSTTQTKEQDLTFIERIITWIGSVSSLILHTIVFVVFFALSWLNIMSWQIMLLVLTTAVSLEAIYLAIFIQMTVNKNAREIQEVGEDIDEISEDIDEISEDIDEIGEDIDEMSEDDEVDEAHREKQNVTLERLTNDIKHILSELETLKHPR